MNFDVTIRITFIKTAKPLIAAAKTEKELTRTIAENPNNKSLRTLGVGLENASATRKRVAELYANLESEELKQLNKTFDALTGAELVPITRSIRSAQRIARHAANSFPGIYNESLAKTVDDLSFASESSSRGMISGIKSRYEREVPHLVKSFHALDVDSQ